MIGIMYGASFSPYTGCSNPYMGRPVDIPDLPFWRLFESTYRQRVVTAFTGVNCAFNVVLNIMLIPRFGLMARQLTVITEALGFILLLMYILKNVVKISLVSLFVRNQC